MKTKDLLIIGALGLGAYFLLLRKQTPQQTQETPPMTGFSLPDLSSLTSGFSLPDLSSFLTPLPLKFLPFNPLTSATDLFIQYQNALTNFANMFRQQHLSEMKRQAQEAQALAEANRQAARRIMEAYNMPPVVQGPTPTSPIRYPTTQITAFKTPVPTGKGITPYGISATDSKGNVIATGFKSIAQAKAYEALHR